MGDLVGIATAQAQRQAISQDHHPERCERSVTLGR